MTANNLRKSDLTEIFKEIDAKNIDEKILVSLKHIISNEVDCSIVSNGTDKHLTKRNIVCFYNMQKYLLAKNFEDAWWEFADIVSYHEEDDFISIDEVVLLDIALTMFLQNILN